MIISEHKDFESVSIPAISTESDGISIKEGAKIICKAVKSFIKRTPEFKNKTIIFCNYDEETVRICLLAFRLKSLEKQHWKYLEKSLMILMRISV